MLLFHMQHEKQFQQAVEFHANNAQYQLTI